MPAEDPSLPFTIGPLPDVEGRLQFKVLQTYADGTEDAWIEEWVAGEPEPDRPGPVLDLVAGAAGTIPSSTETTPTTEAATATTEAGIESSTTAAPTTQPTTTTSIAATDTAAPTLSVAPDDDSSDDSNTAVWIVLAIVAVIAIGVVVYLVRRGRNNPAS